MLKCLNVHVFMLFVFLQILIINNIIIGDFGIPQCLEMMAAIDYFENMLVEASMHIRNV